MSTCISSHGEYDAHETDPDTFVCKWCHEFDEHGALAEVARLRGRPVTPKIGIQAAPLSQAIHGGTLNKDGTLFLHKEDVTEDALRAVAEFVRKHFKGSGRFEFADGLVLDVDVNR